MRRLRSLLWIAGFIAVSLVATRAAEAPTIVLPGQGNFMQAPAPYPAAIAMAVLAGDPTKAGSPYTVRLRLPAGTKIPPHTHSDVENVTVLSGTLMVGLGSTFNASSMKALPAGSFVSIPAGVAHYAMSQGETVLQVTGLGPAGMTLEK